MKIYIHHGNGHWYMGSTVIVIENDEQLAREMIRKTLDDMGLHHEQIYILEEEEIVTGKVIFSESGDY
jgi:hypothetical protein